MEVCDLSSIEEISEGIITQEELHKELKVGSAVVLKGKARRVAIGSRLLVKVNVSIGCSDKHGLPEELKKLETLSHLSYRPDVMMDLSIVRPQRPLYRSMIETFGGPVGTLPHYLCYSPGQGIDPSELLEEVQRQAEAGVAWMTLHVTPRTDIYEMAKQIRSIPSPSRGGSIVIHDMILNKRGESVLSLYFDKILSILGANEVAISIGAAFRPSTILEALDPVHRREIDIQGEYIREAHQQGVQVMTEGIGHATLDKVAEYVTIVRSRYRVPMVPLGPIPTDAAIGEDHVSNAIGSAYMALIGGADLINSVTREEHTGDIPSFESVIEGLRAARVAAHAVNIVRYPIQEAADIEVADRRRQRWSCVVAGGLFDRPIEEVPGMGCTRCRRECPLLIARLIHHTESHEIQTSLSDASSR